MRHFVQQALNRAIANINSNQFPHGIDYQIEQWNEYARLVA